MPITKYDIEHNIKMCYDSVFYECNLLQDFRLKVNKSTQVIIQAENVHTLSNFIVSNINPSKSELQICKIARK